MEINDEEFSKQCQKIKEIYCAELDPIYEQEITEEANKIIDEKNYYCLKRALVAYDRLVKKYFNLEPFMDGKEHAHWNMCCCEFKENNYGFRKA